MPTLTNNRDPEVTITQQGDLTAGITAVNKTVGGNHSFDFEVPTGKKWRLLHGGAYAASGLTITSWTIQVSYDGAAGNFIPIYSNSTGADDYLLPSPIDLPSGAKIRIKVFYTHSSDADLTGRTLYIESDS